MANRSVARTSALNQPPIPQTPTPTFKDILTAPDDQWQALATRAGADLDFCKRARATYHQRQQNPKPKSKRTRRQRPSRARRTPSPTSLLSHIAPAMAETLDRANTQETILINRPGGFVEVLS